MSSRDPKAIILDAALTTFVELGFERATIADIRTRAGISNGALFHHFPSKDAIAEALYLRGIASYQEGLVAALARGGEDNARETVAAAVRHHLAWVERDRALASFMYERGRPDWQPSHGAGVRKLNRSAAAHVRDWIAPLAAKGVLRDLPLPVLAACVVGPAHFIARRWLSGMITARPTSFADALTEAAWAALSPGKVRRFASPAQAPLPSTLAETAALAALSDGSWMTAQMTLNAVAASMPVSARVGALQKDASGATAFVEIELLDADGVLAMRAHFVCVRRTNVDP